MMVAKKCPLQPFCLSFALFTCDRFRDLSEQFVVFPRPTQVTPTRCGSKQSCDVFKQIHQFYSAIRSTSK